GCEVDVLEVGAFFFSSRRRHTRLVSDWSSDVCSSDLRYDWHRGLAPAGDDGLVGDPHFIVRVGKSTGSVIVGGQLGIWVPGKDEIGRASCRERVEIAGGGG